MIPPCVRCGRKIENQVVAECWHWPEGEMWSDYSADAHVCISCEVSVIGRMYVEERDGKKYIAFNTP